jgi:hypothetical protein
MDHSHYCICQINMYLRFEQTSLSSGISSAHVTFQWMQCNAMTYAFQRGSNSYKTKWTTDSINHLYTVPVFNSGHFCDTVLVVVYSSMVNKGNKNMNGWSWMENKITENQWKITKTICFLFSNVLFLTVLTLSCNIRQHNLHFKQVIIPPRAELVKPPMLALSKFYDSVSSLS